jgi:transposase-like protein
MYKNPDQDVYIGDSHPKFCPRCREESVVDDGRCRDGCCDDYRCTACGYTFRVELPD